jgi:hypothetical protein
LHFHSTPAEIDSQCVSSVTLLPVSLKSEKQDRGIPSKAIPW